MHGLVKVERCIVNSNTKGKVRAEDERGRAGVEGGRDGPEGEDGDKGRKGEEEPKNHG